MTADESGLPPLDPAKLHLPEFNSGGELMKWLIQTVLDLPDVTEEQRLELATLVRRIEFTDIMKAVSADMINDLINDQIEKLDWDNAQRPVFPPKPKDEGEPTE